MLRLWQSRRVHHALCVVCVSIALCKNVGPFKDLGLGVFGLCVSDRALARRFGVSAPPVSGSRKPFPTAEGRDRFDSVGDQFACPRGGPLNWWSSVSEPEHVLLP